MGLAVVTLETMLAKVPMGHEMFEEIYPGTFLLALGYLATQKKGVSPSRPSSSRDAEVLRRSQLISLKTTLNMKFGKRLKPTMQDHPLAGYAFFLPYSRITETFIIGRKTSCDVIVPDISVSDKHCSIKLDESGQLLVTDLNSTNGTTANMLKITPGLPTPISDEGVLTIGRYCFEFFHVVSMFKNLQAF